MRIDARHVDLSLVRFNGVVEMLTIPRFNE